MLKITYCVSSFLSGSAKIAANPPTSTMGGECNQVNRPQAPSKPLYITMGGVPFEDPLKIFAVLLWALVAVIEQQSTAVARSFHPLGKTHMKI